MLLNGKQRFQSLAGGSEYKRHARRMMNSRERVQVVVHYSLDARSNSQMMSSMGDWYKFASSPMVILRLKDSPLFVYVHIVAKEFRV